MGLLDDLAGDDKKQPERSRPRRKVRARDQGRVFVAGPPKDLRPDEVSERVWGIAEQWLETGAAHFGKPVAVNKREFAKRLATKIRNDRSLGVWLRRPPDFWDYFGSWDDGYDFVNEVLAKMSDLFWGHLIEAQKNIPAIQYDFLDREWDEWVYQAVTAIQVAWLKDHESWGKPGLPSRVFDRATVGRPEDDEPCTDPEFAGMTWGEVRALREEDSRDLPSLSEEQILAEQQAEKERRAERLAIIKGAMVANRSSTTKETTDADPPPA